MASRPAAPDDGLTLGDEPTLATRSIQGNIIPGFATDDLALIGLAITDRARAKRYLGSLSGRVTTAAHLLEHRAAARRLGVRPRPTRRDAWLNVAFSHAALTDLGVEPFYDPSFRGGHDRDASTRLGDLDPDPAHWVANREADPVDVLLLVAAGSTEATVEAGRRLRDEAVAHGLRCTYEEGGRRLVRSIEHFGFIDGISQPALLGMLDTDPSQALSARPWPALPDGTGALFVDPGTPLLWPGECIFGYPGQRGTDRAAGPVPRVFQDPARDEWGKDGAFLVFRRLRQHVGAFWSYCEQQASELAAGPIPGATRELVGAMIVGRWRDGSPVKLDDPDFGAARTPDNAFDLSADPFGYGCPLGAHIRKVNPRSGAISDTSPLEKRVIRRGIPFGAAMPGIVTRGDPDRGLLFLAYMTSITDQFEFLMTNWINSGTAPSGAGTGDDVLVGQPNHTRTMTVELPNGETRRLAPASRFVEPTGGQYLFSPSIEALARLGG